MKGMNYRRMLIPAILVAGLLPMSSMAQTDLAVKSVMQAYTLRTTGHADSARTILQGILEKDSTDAMANFEMARLIEGMNPLQVGEAMHYYDAAVKEDPQNSFYRFYRAKAVFLKAFIGMHGDDADVGELIGETGAAFEDVLKTDPECTAALLYLTDIYGVLPADMGGDSAKAVHYAKMLKPSDRFAVAQSEVILSRGEMDEVEFWKSYIAQNGESVNALERLGKAYLMNDDIENAKSCFNKVIEDDPSKQVLLLDLGRKYIYRVMQGGEDKDANLAKVKEYMLQYLESPGTKPVSIQAWCYGVLGRVEMFQGNQEESQKYLQKAQELDTYFSRAMAVPSVDDPPNALTYNYSSFFRPF